METLLIQIRPQTAFGTSIRGDTLFGQFCWAAANRFGQDRLHSLLDDYTEGRPYLICSDAFPSGHIPRPPMPMSTFTQLDGVDRKIIKKRRWLPIERVSDPVESWLLHALQDGDIADELYSDEQDNVSPSGVRRLQIEHPQPHNSIHRTLNTTQGGEFAPYILTQHWYLEGLIFDVWLMFDDQRISKDELLELAADIGMTGYGRDASVGLGKFKLEHHESKGLPKASDAGSFLTLAPCAPQGLGLNEQACFYEPFTRFGRHGDRAVLSGKPFKNPVLLADTGAVLSHPQPNNKGYFGQGLGGLGKLSIAIADTVHQGYAPCIGINLKQAAA